VEQSIDEGGEFHVEQFADGLQLHRREAHPDARYSVSRAEDFHIMPPRNPFAIGGPGVRPQVLHSSGSFCTGSRHCHLSAASIPCLRHP
jgi:hypothetical protein